MHEAPWLKPYQFKKGVVTNPKGRPKGKTLKEFARALLEKLPDDEKVEMLNKLPKDLVWKMAEGMPKQDMDVTSKGKQLEFTNDQKNKVANRIIGRGGTVTTNGSTRSSNRLLDTNKQRV